MSSPTQPSLPDFRNLGIALRIAVLAEASRLCLAYLVGTGLGSAFDTYLRQGAAFSPALLSMLALLYLIAPQLKRLPYRQGVAALFTLVALWVWIWNHFPSPLLAQAPTGLAFKDFIGALTLTAGLLGYFDWRQRRLTPAIADARLMALQARIQPHFLYNSLNTVLGLIRDDPRKAEAVLENLAELFRAILSDTRNLIPFAQELALAKAYVDIETIRLGTRLNVVWQCEASCQDCLVPQLILQPLIENTIRHGIEPRENGGTVFVSASVADDVLHLCIRNPVGDADARPGNRMALENLEERLALHYDAEARLDISHPDGEFAVDIHLPYRRATAH